VLYHQSDVTWDTPAAPCNQPDPGLDHNPCRVTDRQVSTAAGAAPGHDTQIVYSEQGLPLITRRATGTGGFDVTTVGFRTQHVGPTRTRVYTDSLAGGGAVTSTTGTSGKRADDGEATLFTVTDRTASLTPRGNNAPQPATATAGTPGWPAYATTYTLDATETVTPGAVPSSGVCTGGAPNTGTNTGLVCAVDAPPFDGTGRASTTRYSYDSFGQRTTMTTPKAIAETPSGSTPPAYGYSYFADGDRDLSATVSAGGWLRAVTDPAGKFVAFGYDAAGNVARTWDRNATTGRPATDFPGTVVTPTNGQYSETLYADPGPGAAPSAASSLASPWRYVRSQRDALGNRTAVTVDENGNPLQVTPPRGTQLATATNSPTSYDTTAAFDPGDLRTALTAPVENSANGAPVTKPTTWSYDPYGNPSASTDPRGVVTAFDYDNANRPVTTTYSRGPAGPDAPAACRTSGAGDTRFTAGVTLCATNTVYDGLGQVTASRDGNGQVSTSGYDAQGRRTDQYTPRDTYTSLHTAVVYDPDGNPTTACRPRQFTDGPSVYDPVTGRYVIRCDAASKYAEQVGYDVAGRRTSSTTYRDSGTPLVTRWAYDADGNPVSSTDPNGHTIATAVDLLDRVTASTAPRSAGVGYTTGYGYDPAGNKTTVTHPVAGAVTRVDAYSYDADNRLLDSVTGSDNPSAGLAGPASADGGSNVRTRAVYDADGHRVAQYGPRAFATSVTSPDPRFLTRTDLDADGRPVAAYTPRYDTADPAFTDPTGTGGTQASECPTGVAPAAVPVPASMPAVPGYPATVGVCVTRSSYDPVAWCWPGRCRPPPAPPPGPRPGRSATPTPTTGSRSGRPRPRRPAAAPRSPGPVTTRSGSRWRSPTRSGRSAPRVGPRTISRPDRPRRRHRPAHGQPLHLRQRRPRQPHRPQRPHEMHARRPTQWLR